MNVQYLAAQLACVIAIQVALCTGPQDESRYQDAPHHVIVSRESSPNLDQSRPSAYGDMRPKKNAVYFGYTQETLYQAKARSVEDPASILGRVEFFHWAAQIVFNGPEGRMLYRAMPTPFPRMVPSWSDECALWKSRWAHMVERSESAGIVSTRAQEQQPIRGGSDIQDCGLMSKDAGQLTATQSTWIGAWASSPRGLPTMTKWAALTIPAPMVVQGTIRYRLRLSQGGSSIRLRLSNEYGQTPLTIGGISVGIAGDGLEALPGTLTKALVAESGSIVIPPGAPVLTDPIALAVKPLSDLIVSIYLPEATPIFAWDYSHPSETSEVDPGIAFDTDATLRERLKINRRALARPIVSAVSVLTDGTNKVVVALGDSITDGWKVDPASGDRGWPGVLSRRLQSRNVSVVNAGIAGNRLLRSIPFFGESALSRLDQDVLSVPGLTHIIVLEGINDINMSGPHSVLRDSALVKPEELVAAYSQIIARAHEQGVKVFGGTLLPFGGAPKYSTEKESVRDAVNTWIRTSGAFDGVIDFDMILRDPMQPNRLKAEYDGGDGVHPSSAGYQAMGEAVDLNLFN